MSSMQANFVQIEVKQTKILNINRSCIIKTNLLLFISHKLIFLRFSHKTLSIINFSTFRFPLQNRLLLKWSVKNVLKWRKVIFPRICILYLVWCNFMLLYFSNLDRTQGWVLFAIFSGTKQYLYYGIDLFWHRHSQNTNNSSFK